MNISGLVQSYDSRAASSAALTRAIMAPNYMPVHAFNGAHSNNMVVAHPQMQQNNPFSFAPYTGAGQNRFIPAYANYIQQRPLPSLTQPDTSYARYARQGFIEEHHSQSPPIKSEPQWSGQVKSPSFPSANTKTITASTPATGSNKVNFGTEVDTLMKAIQAKTQSTTPQKPLSADQSRPVIGVFRKLTQKDIQEEGSPKGGKKRYQCTIENCTKAFYQKSHLDIHERAHTGVKPYPCNQPGCGRSFSQLGNLKTHERRHTGERPYHCEICGKRFAQRGNVRAHKIVHNQSKPYLCRLDDCGKQFTQLGNLKSHQNKFHIATIRALTNKFASIKDGDIVHAADKELWEYFANLYKNSNKGIKGRGKDRKVGSNNSSALPSLVPDLSVSGACRENMIIGAGVIGAYDTRRGESGQYEMFNFGEGSQSRHSGSGGVSSVETCDDDLPLAFEERIY